MSEPSVVNVVGRVSVGHPSYIDGQVQVTGSDAHLYLVNPSGMLFGPNGQLSLQGSFTATTANQIGFGEAWLWQVSDIGTLALMSKFYARLESNELRFEALRQAQLALLNGETRIEQAT